MSDLITQQTNQSLIAAFSDADAISIYLSQRDANGELSFSTRTIESYRRDIKRFQVYLDGTPFKQVTLNQVNDLILWLKSPPQELIALSCRRPIDHPDWQPFFKSGLSQSSVQQQMASLKAFFSWLLNTGYLSQNPVALIKNAKQKNPKTPKRQLYTEDLKAVAKYLKLHDDHADSKASRSLNRQRWLWYAYLLSGLRISELLNHSTGELYTEIVNGEKIWMIAVVGKGRVDADPHPLPDHFMQELWRYRKSLGLHALPSTAAPLVLSLTGNNGLTSRSAAHKAFKALIDKVSVFQENQGHHDSATRLSNASTHWLRHSFVSTLLNITTDLPAVSHLARHRDIKTTMNYDHSELPVLKGLLNQLAEEIV